MITVFFNEDGYYVTGEGVDVARRCSPALTSKGDRIFQTIHHSYKVLYLALCELRDMNVQDDIIIYNDSRIIDEINGYVDALDSSCDEWLKIIRRDAVPDVRSLIFFRKKPGHYIKSTIADAHGKMLPRLDGRQRQALAERETKLREARKQHRTHKLIDRLKKSWFGDNNG